MHRRTLAAAALLAVAAAGPARAQVEIRWWHSMTGGLNDWVVDLANGFNAGQNDDKVVATDKGPYAASMTAAIAALRAGNAPHVLQVFEVGSPPVNLLARRAEGARCHVAGQSLAPPAPAPRDGALRLGVRPEHAALRGADRIDAGWPLHIEMLEMPGAERLVFGRVGDAAFTLRVDGTLAPPRAGTALALAVATGPLHWFDEAGRRVG